VSQVKLDPRFVRGDTPYFSSRQLMLRLLNNLRQIYLTLNMAEEALGIVRWVCCGAGVWKRCSCVCGCSAGALHTYAAVLLHCNQERQGRV
jgi:hypothetical protein